MTSKPHEDRRTAAESAGRDSARSGPTESSAGPARSASSPHSVLDDLNGLREEAEHAHNQYHDWKKVPYWDCPLSPCSWFNNDLPLIEQNVRGLLEQVEALERKLTKTRAEAEEYRELWQEAEGRS